MSTLLVQNEAAARSIYTPHKEWVMIDVEEACAVQGN